MVVTQQQTQKTADILQQAFPNLDVSSVQALSRAAREIHFPAGSILCKQGEIGTCLFVIQSGEVAVFVRADSETEVQVNTVLPYNYSGEMALLIDDSVRSATLKAMVDSNVLVIDRDPFLEIADANPSLLRRLAGQLTDHLRNNDRAVINELRTKNKEIQKAYQDLEEQEQMRREFVTTLSHELRTPLTSIQGYLQLMNRGVIKGDSLQVALKSVTQNVEKMVGMTNNLLVLYEMQLTALKYTELVLPDLLMESVRKLHSTPEYLEAAVSVDIGTNVPLLNGDKAGLTLALHALIENAVKFSPEDAAVEIAGTVPESGWIRVDVIDYGVGIPEEEREKIFEPFYRLEHKQGKNAQNLFAGIGIGLSIAKFIVERHGGRIELTSQLDEGSTFSIYLPTAHV